MTVPPEEAVKYSKPINILGIPNILVSHKTIENDSLIEGIICKLAFFNYICGSEIYPRNLILFFKFRLCSKFCKNKVLFVEDIIFILQSEIY